jgi:hypothetical protein
LTPGELGPLGAAFALAGIAGLFSRRLAPQSATRLLAISSTATLAAVVWGLVLVALAGLAGRTGPLWPQVVPEHHRVPEPLGIAAISLLLLGAGCAATTAVRLRRTRRRWQTRRPIELHDLDEPVAFAVPGRPGGVVVDRHLWSSLDRGEQRALVAHEQAHLYRHHHRHVALAELVAAACPLLSPQRSAIRLSVERWADEDAALAVGDRLVVARAIARAALVSTPSPMPLGFGGSAPLKRVEALLEPPPRTGPWSFLGRVDTVAVVALAALQLHHLVVFLTHVD